MDRIDFIYKPAREEPDSVVNVRKGRSFLDDRKGRFGYFHIGIEILRSHAENIIHPKRCSRNDSGICF
jgi:hypothetical protein